ncbi:hypothetical protein DMB44_07945 [Thermoplasma sp. Kam2015]|uniref:hypothetical protein n=1 Tax=Thermoplasma sp. Kam2015 TaxID=2094122 RepID=UPI000DA05B6C|nr:hypothetical protein [Thermoplasma sp. Kam2015]PYB67810.1 hypothetical protein DMB44_07945 [Thermoplasma sp. Kam2015]
MKPIIVKKGDIRRLLKESGEIDGNDGRISVAARILYEFGDRIVFVKAYENEDIDLKIKNRKNDYRYVKVIGSQNGEFHIIDLPIGERKIGTDTLYNKIISSETFGSGIRNEILNMISFEMKRRNSIWILVDKENHAYYPFTTHSITEIILHDVEYRFERGMIERTIEIKVPVQFIDNYWQRYLKSKNRTPGEVWASMIVQ